MYDDFYLNFFVVVVVNVIIHKQTLSFFNENKQNENGILKLAHGSFLSFLCYAKPLLCFLIVRHDLPLVFARSRAKFQVHDAPMAYRDLIKRRVGQIQVFAIAATPTFIAFVGMITRTRIRYFYDDRFHRRLLTSSPLPKFRPFETPRGTVHADHLYALPALLGQTVIVAAVRLYRGDEVIPEILAVAARTRVNAHPVWPRSLGPAVPRRSPRFPIRRVEISKHSSRPSFKLDVRRSLFL